MRTGPDNRYYSLNAYLRSRFGCRVQKITIDAGLTCPNRDGTITTGGCIYCNARGSGSGAHARGLSIGAQVRQGAVWMRKRYKARKFMAYFQSFSNTYAPLEQLARMYQEALDQEDVVGLFIGTRPDCVDDAVLDLLQSLSKRTLVWMEYGLQSASDSTLKRINRGHDFKAFADAVNELLREKQATLRAIPPLVEPNDSSQLPSRLVPVEVPRHVMTVVSVQLFTAAELFVFFPYVCQGVS